MNDKCNPVMIGGYPDEKNQIMYFFSLCEEHREAAIVGPKVEVFNLDKMRELFEDELMSSLEILGLIRTDMKFATFLMAVKKYIGRGECPGDNAFVYNRKLYSLHKTFGETFAYISGVDLMAIPKSYAGCTVFEPLFIIKFGGDTFEEMLAEAERIKQEYPEYAEMMDAMRTRTKMTVDRSKYAEIRDQREDSAA